MKGLRWAALGVGAVASAAWFLGPRAHVDPPQGVRFDLPPAEDLTSMLAGREAGYSDLIPGTEKRIVWADTASAATDWALVYLHGFSASRQETAPLAERVASRLGANLYEARLSGHGRDGAALGKATAASWIRDAQEAAAIGRVIGRRTAVLACSTGATLAALLSAHGAWDVDAHVWISPNFGPLNPAAAWLTWPWARTWVPWLTGKERSWEAENAAQARYWTTRYPMDVLFEMQALVDAAQEAPLGQVMEPVLLFYSPEDPVVDPARVERAFTELGSASRRKVRVDGPGDHHVLAGRILSPARTASVADTSVEFLKGL